MFYDRLFEELKQFSKTQDFTRLGQFFKSDAYLNYRRDHPKIIRKGPLTDRDFEEILEALRTQNWDRFDELIDSEHAEEIMERLMETAEWEEVDCEHSEKLYDLNWSRIQHCTPAQRQNIL